MKLIDVKRKVSTDICMSFKATCPIPEEPRMYYGEATLRYSSRRVFDFNDVADILESFVSKGDRSVEDVALFLLHTTEVHIPKAERIGVQVCIPEQSKHLKVTVRVGCWIV